MVVGTPRYVCRAAIVGMRIWRPKRIVARLNICYRFCHRWTWTWLNGHGTFPLPDGHSIGPFLKMVNAFRLSFSLCSAKIRIVLFLFCTWYTIFTFSLGFKNVIVKTYMRHIYLMYILFTFISFLLYLYIYLLHTYLFQTPRSTRASAFAAAAPHQKEVRLSQRWPAGDDVISRASVPPAVPATWTAFHVGSRARWRAALPFADPAAHRAS